MSGRESRLSGQSLLLSPRESDVRAAGASLYPQNAGCSPFGPVVVSPIPELYVY